MESETIGIIGGGQLGQMLTLAALPLGYKVIVIDPNDNCSAKQVGAEQIVAAFDNAQAIRELAKRSDYITVESEHVNVDAMAKAVKLGKPVNPAPQTIAMIQDKFAQKQFLQFASIPVAPFTDISDEASAVAALKEFGDKMLLKTRRGAYDGRGNVVISSPDEIAPAFEKFAGQTLYAEEFIPFQKELAVMVARSTDGKTATYPVVETIQVRSICTEVLAPAPIDADLSQKAEAVASAVASHITGAGVFGIELFLTKAGDIIVNEIAPRVHNSGHYTIEACATSQFEQHIRAISGLPLGSTEMIVPAAVMINILGERNGETEVTGANDVLTIPGANLHLYGKSPTKIDRKMGHITVTASTLEEARTSAQHARKSLNI